jgi:hypothetical protein
MKVAKLSALHTGRPLPLLPQEIFLVLISVRIWVNSRSHSAAGRIMSMKNSIDTIGNRTSDLPACSAMRQRTAPKGKWETFPWACGWPLTSIQYWGEEWLDLYLHSHHTNLWCSEGNLWLEAKCFVNYALRDVKQIPFELQPVIESLATNYVIMSKHTLIFGSNLLG